MDKSVEIFEKLRASKSLTYKEIAVATGIDTSTISCWIKGKYLPKNEKLKKIADYFGVSLAYLMGESETPFPSTNDGTYWLDKETAEIAQKIFENKNLRLLFSSAIDSKPEDLKLVHDMLSRLKSEESGDK